MKQLIDVEKSVENIDGNEEVEEVKASEICEIIENSDIEPDKKQRVIAQIMKEEFQGPIPPPHILEQYKDIRPEYADTIINMAVKEQEHRHDMENKLVSSEVNANSERANMIKASVKMKSRLQIFGFLVTMLLLVAGIFFIYTDKNVGSIVPFILAVGSFCWTMFYGKKSPEENGANEPELENGDAA